MRPIVLTSLILVLTLPGAVYAQKVPETGRTAAFGQEVKDLGVPGAPVAGEPIPAAPAPGMPVPDARAPAAGPQKPPRSEKAIGPDLMAYIFAPIGAVVTPVARDLHGVDAALAPINEALLPITGPLDPALFQPAGEAAPSAATPEPIQPPALARPAKAGPRK